MLLPSVCRVPISHSSDTSEARRLARTMATGIGFSLTECEDLAIVASELASNLIKHATGGKLVFTPLNESGRLGIKMESLDEGPGIADIELAMADGFSTTGSLGYGLGAVNRLMDELKIRPRSDGKPGTQITCLRWRLEHHQMGVCPLSFGAATRACRGMELNGDAYLVKRWNNSALVALIDGLGHGQQANIAAQAAREYIENHYNQPLEKIVQGADRACRATRGVVMALARFDWQLQPVRLSFISVGNIEARVNGNPTIESFPAYRGVIGLNASDPVAAEDPWHPDYTLVLHTDGLRTNWRWDDFPGLAALPPADAARRLLQDLAKEEDDATVIVVGKNKSIDISYE